VRYEIKTRPRIGVAYLGTHKIILDSNASESDRRVNLKKSCGECVEVARVPQKLFFKLP